MSDTSAHPSHPRTFVLRLVLDEQAGVHGQASEPGSPDNWRVTFSSLSELIERLWQRLIPAGPVAGLAAKDEPHFGQHNALEGRDFNE